MINRVFTVKLILSKQNKVDLFNYIAQSLILFAYYAWNCLPSKVLRSENMRETFVIHGKVLRIDFYGDDLLRTHI